MDLIYIVLLSLLGGTLGLLGGILFLYSSGLSLILEKYSVSFASGVLITISLFGLIPESLEKMGYESLIIFFISFVSIFIFEKFFFGLHHHDDDNHHKIKKSSTFFVIIGDSIHNFIDGVTIAAGYLTSPGLGIIYTVSSFLHEIPHEVGDFGVLLKAGWKKSTVLVVNLISSFLTVTGGLFVYFYVNNEFLNAILMSVSAGIFFYLGLIDFMPKFSLKDGFKPILKKFIPFLVGLLSVALVLNLIPHDH